MINIYLYILFVICYNIFLFFYFFIFFYYQINRCSGDTVLLHWPGYILMVGPFGDWIR